MKRVATSRCVRAAVMVCAALAAGRGAGAASVAEYGLPTVVTRAAPVSAAANPAGRTFVDFGQEAFGWLELLPPPGCTGGVCQVVLGEAKLPDGRVDAWPGGTIRSQRVECVLPAGDAPFRVPLRRDARNTDFSLAVPPVKLRPETGVVMPFRYAEFYAAPFSVTSASVRQARVHYPIDQAESSFACSDARLTRVYDFCKYTIVATSFAGLYVDGDRERVPYEADAYINQLGHYAISSDGALARASHEYLLRHPTWPTEWKQHSIMMAWADWMWTGATDSVARCYATLKDEKLLLSRARPDGLLASEPERFRPHGERDLIDWPPRDRDGYVFSPASAVINAFFFRNLREMADLARALGRTDDAAAFDARAARVRARYNDLFRDPADGLYRDGEGVAHKGLHANAAALAFGLVLDGDRARVADALAARGMVCSVYFAQYLLEALYAGGRDDAALALMTASSDRSWLGMMAQGATVAFEAWNMNDKPNLDWNHAWGTPPLNIISRYVLGVTPLEPGFAKALIRPRPGGLARVKGTVPTVRGGIEVEIDGGTLRVNTPVPARIVWNGTAREVTSGRCECR